MKAGSARKSVHYVVVGCSQSERAVVRAGPWKLEWAGR